MLVATMLSLLVALLFLGPQLVFVVQALGNPLPEKGRKMETNEREYTKDLLSLINHAAKEIWMVRGEVRAGVFGPEVARALARAMDRGVKVSLVCGPWVNVDDEGKNALLDLADEEAKNGRVALYYRDREAQPACHFTEADGNALYWEEPHWPRTGEREVWFLRHHDLVSAKWRDYVARQIRSGMCVRVGSSRDEHIQLTRSEEDTLRETLKDGDDPEGNKLYTMAGDDIRALASRIQRG